MRFPSIEHVQRSIRDVNRFADGECEVRLQVYEDGSWAIRSGDSSYDQDHRGYWGASCVPGAGKRFRSRDIAKGLIDQAREQKACTAENAL